MWCEVCSHGIIGPYFFENAKGRTVLANVEQYKVMLVTFLYWAPSRQQVLLCFQQDGVTAHTAEISMQVLRTVFLGRLISRFGDITFPACWPDHGVPDCFLWGYVKSKVYETHPANTADWKQQILECIQGIFKEVVQRVMTFFQMWLQ